MVLERIPGSFSQARADFPRMAEMPIRVTHLISVTFRLKVPGPFLAKNGDMATVLETLQELRSQYVGEAGENLGRIDRLIRRLAVQPDREALEHLHRRFLGLAGSGYTYGFPVVSSLGRQGERICASALQDERGLSPADVAACVAVLSGLREEVVRLQAVYAMGPWIKRAPRAQTWATGSWVAWERGS